MEKEGPRLDLKENLHYLDILAKALYLKLT